MKVLDRKPLALSKVKEMVKDLEEKENLRLYLKRFSALDLKKSEELTEELESLNNAKIKTADIVKVVDFLPKDSEEVNKIFIDVSLSEEEINKVLEIVKKYGA